MSTNQPTSSATTTETAPTLILRLRPKVEEKHDNEQHITWEKDVIDNEHMGKKSSKKCCIFHKARAFGESDSDESDSDWEGFDKEDDQKEP
mmetsp:Transcript_10625/g.12902  ORF Transcript_10625/g.12902 Transcript_10625/m.12902 type:complete len:91 (+) Transcript_10625:158-430(+)|eukprot:CAMPEP_0114342340 /NCGR_PEP_ID=MMETSP0101-20121206/9729_1 /TAXON_ID=38822 ORGANISM="Pteridomonas danica, Strain PT" /NCGR_SAMPLE_ID=MMETSP0101 /ASSEMBLY_ACC=CAM_ASM_000211 /LENGTH=90 /DNA_ID=CAMNT_0001476405 /DNA_START=111 /DNA_END=383 /DNA_ORIENTATION=+